MTDRIRFNEGKPQVYGTVLDWNQDGELSCVVEDPEVLDSRRQEMGLPSRSGDDLAAYRAQVQPEGGAPPRDFAKA